MQPQTISMVTPKVQTEEGVVLKGGCAPTRLCDCTPNRETHTTVEQLRHASNNAPISPSSKQVRQGQLSSSIPALKFS